MTKHILHRFQYCPQCGHGTQETAASPYRCESCGFQFYFSPTAAVGAIIVNENGEVLFLIRGRDPGKGKYGLPGGFVDAGETLEDALRREVYEETQLEVVQVEYLCSYPNVYVYRESSVDVTDAFFVCRVSPVDQPKAQPGEVDGFLLTRPTQEVLDNMAFESNRKAVELYLNSAG